MLSGKSAQYKELSQFRDLKDFNNHFEQWMIDIKGKFTKSELVALKRLVRFSASIQGVCYAKIQTIVAATHEFDGVGISRSTFKRMLTKAKEVGLLIVHHTFRNGKQSHSIYVFNKYHSISVQPEPPKGEQLNQQNESINLLKTSNILNKRNGRLSTDFVSNRVPKEFTQYVQSFYHDAQTVEELFRVVSIQTRYLTYYSENDRIELALDAFKQLVRNIKMGRKVKNIFGYFWGIVSQMLDKEYLELLANSA
ncbi:hypothetical protein [Neobacillus drentensis]|uniref:hypothetical protein n=1 Tax=Neobacillus drentensis TaxID=220684 RepID=UPI002FFD7F0E